MSERLMGLNIWMDNITERLDDLESILRDGEVIKEIWWKIDHIFDDEPASSPEHEAFERDKYEPTYEEIGYRTTTLQDAYYSGSVPGLGAWERAARESLRLEREAVDRAVSTMESVASDRVAAAVDEESAAKVRASRAELALDHVKKNRDALKAEYEASLVRNIDVNQAMENLEAERDEYREELDEAIEQIEQMKATPELNAEQWSEVARMMREACLPHTEWEEINPNAKAEWVRTAKVAVAEAAKLGAFAGKGERMKTPYTCEGCAWKCEFIDGPHCSVCTCVPSERL